MRVSDVIANLPMTDTEATREFYGGWLGLDTGMDQGWVVRFLDAEAGAHLQLVTRDATAPEDSVATIRVEDVDAAYEAARRHGFEIVHPLATESWGVRRFFVRDPSGNVLNIAQAHG